MSASMLLGLFSWIDDFFKALFDLIPKLIYLFWASLACVLDVLQLFFRKLAGLDVYYMTENGKTTMIAGDIVTQFIAGILGWDIGADKYNYSTLSTVFYSMILFGIIVCFGCILIAIIKSHYSYDEKSAKGPMQYVYAGVKSVVNMIAVPVIVVLGLYVSQALLQALDSITTINSSSIIEMYGSDNVNNYLRSTRTKRSEAAGSTNSSEVTYSYYDIFGAYSHILYGTASDKNYSESQYGLIAATSQTFSGSMFKVAAFNANRARKSGWNINDEGIYDNNLDKFTGLAGSGDKQLKLFSKASSNEELADMIDTAFANNLHLQKGYDLNYIDASGGAWASRVYFNNFYTQNVRAFSKFNIGVIWYYYDLWEFNFLVGFASIIVGASLFVNIIMGLITRLFMCIGLFLISPPLFGLAPLDGGKAGKSWRENFMKQVLMTYGAVVGMNIFFLMLPYFNKISFFNIEIADYFAQTLIIIVGLITIKAFIAVCSALIGAEDANASGAKIAGEVGGTIKGAAKMTGAAAKFAYKHTPAGWAVHAGVASAKHGIGKLGEKMMGTGDAPTKFGKAIGAFKDPTAAIDAGMANRWKKQSETAEKKKLEKELTHENIKNGKESTDKLLASGDKLAEVFDRLRDGSMTASEAMKKLQNGSINGATFNASQSKFVVDQMMGAGSMQDFRDKMTGLKRDDKGNPIKDTGTETDKFKVWGDGDSKANIYKNSVSKPYRDAQAGYIKDNNEAWNRAKAVGSSGFGDMYKEAYGSVLKGDTFKVFDDARAKKKENEAKAKEQARHGEEIAALKSIEAAIKSNKPKK